MLGQSSELSSRSNTSRTTDSDSDGDNILEAVATFFRSDEAGSEKEEYPPNSFVARVLPHDRVEFQQHKPEQSCKHLLLLRNRVSDDFSGASCRPRHVSSEGVGCFNYKSYGLKSEEEEEGNLRISLDVEVTAKATHNSPCYHIQMHLNRSASEAASRTLERLQISLNRKLLREERLDTTTFTPPKQSIREERIARATRRKAECTSQASVWMESSDESGLMAEEEDDDLDGYRRLDVQDSTTSASLWQELSQAERDCKLKIQIGGETYDYEDDAILPVVACPPTILSVQTFMDFTASVFVGVPLALEIETIHTSELAVVWFAGEEEVSRGSLVYTPTQDDVGKTVSVLLIPIRSDHNGKGFEEAYTFAKPVEPLPDLPLISPLREKWINRDESNGHLRVFTYNLLADLYASREVDQKAMYNHCPFKFLDKRTRMPLLLYEMCVFKPDVICLQEVDLSAYSSLFRPVLESQGYQGFFSNKASSQLEGCAMFWSLKCFERVQETKMRTYCLRDFFQDHAGPMELSESMHGIVQLLEQHEELSRVVRSKVGQVLQAVELRVWNDAAGRPKCIVVGNTHLFYHPMADHVRALQACLVCHQLEDFRKECSPCAACPLVFCGDLNSNPLSGAVRLLLHGILEPDHGDAWKYLHQYEWNMGDEDYLLEHGYIGNEVDSGDPVYEDEAYEDAVEYLSKEEEDSLSSQPKPPLLTVPHNFPELVLGYEETPVFTNYAVDFSETLDYVFASKPSKQEPYGFATAKAAPMPSEEFMKDFVAMPNKNMPSDHVSLLCDLEWVSFNG